MLDDISDIEHEDLLKFCDIKCTGKVIFTAKDYNDISCAVQINEHKKVAKLKPYLLDVNLWTEKMPQISILIL